MSHPLPDYLRMRVNAAPHPDRVFTFDGVRITVITKNLLRIEQGAFTDEATLTVLCRDFCACEVLERRTAHTLTLETGELTLALAAGKPLSEGLTITRKTRPAFVWHYGEKPLQNLGGTTSTLDTADGACPIEDGILSVDGFSIIDDSKTPIMTKDGWFAPRETCTDLYFFGYGRDYERCLADYYRLTGVPSMLPAFALGNWWSRYHKYTDKEYLDLMDRFEAEDVPLSVGIVDMDWHVTDDHGRRPYHKDLFNDGWTGYTWNEELFPDYKAFLKEIHARGLKTALNLHPASGVRSHEAQYEKMCEAMGQDPATGEPVRFNSLDPQFLKAYFEVLHFPYEQDGVDFWWMDWQQGNDFAYFAGKDYKGKGLEAITPLWMLNHMHSMAAKREGKRSLIFSRYSGYGSQRYPIGFSGDTFITWASLDFQPYFTATASNIGYGWWSHDIGGHMGGTRDDELAARWTQLGVFSPIFRLHSSNSPFTGREPWRFNQRAERIMEDFMRLRHRLFPYLYTMCERNCSALIPLVRPMYHTHPECKPAYAVPNQYWFGSEIIAAPITRKADGSDLAGAKVWLPEGVWTDAMTGYIYRGNQELTAYRPLEGMPLFMKAGAIVPMQAHEAKSRKLGGAKHLDIYVAPGASNSFTLYEDDGESLDKAQCVRTRMTLRWNEDAAVFTIDPAEGMLDLIPDSREIAVHFRGFRKGCAFTANGYDLEAMYDAATNTYTVVLSDVRAQEGACIVVTNNDGLTHDNRDCRERAVEIITRAQNLQSEKSALMNAFDEALAMKQRGEAVAKFRVGTSEVPSVGGALFELIDQL